MLNDLILLRTSSSLKSIELSLDCVKNTWFAESTLLFFDVVYYSVKSFLEIFAFVWISVTNIGGISGIIFFVIKCFNDGPICFCL